MPRVYLDAAASLGASKRLTLQGVILPSALPQIFAGVRIALALAWVTLVVAESIKPQMPSLGYLLALASPRSGASCSSSTSAPWPSTTRRPAG